MIGTKPAPVRAHSRRQKRQSAIYSVVQSDDPLIDVVFVHGLNEDWLESWHLNDDPSWKTVLRGASPRIAVWSVDYPLPWTLLGFGPPPMQIYDRASNVLGLLKLKLRGNRPIVLVAHSYGGLLIKQMLRNSEGGPIFPDFAERVRGIAFVAVPHDGAGLADYAEALRVLLRSSSAVRELKSSNAQIRELDDYFRGFFERKKPSVIAFRENQPTKGVLVVSAGASDPKLANVPCYTVDADHNAIMRVRDTPIVAEHVQELVTTLLAPILQRSAAGSPLREALAAKNDGQLRRAQVRARAEWAANPSDPAAAQMHSFVSSFRSTEPPIAMMRLPSAEEWPAASRAPRRQRKPSIWLALLMALVVGVGLWLVINLLGWR